MTIGAVFLLLHHQFNAVAAAARRISETAAGAFPEVGGTGIQLVGDATLALLVLLTTTILSVYKPWGRTPFGLRKKDELRATRSRMFDQKSEDANKGFPVELKILLAVVGALVAAFAARHHVGHEVGGPGH